MADGACLGQSGGSNSYQVRIEVLDVVVDYLVGHCCCCGCKSASSSTECTVLISPRQQMSIISTPGPLGRWRSACMVGVADVCAPAPPDDAVQNPSCTCGCLLRMVSLFSSVARLSQYLQWRGKSVREQRGEVERCNSSSRGPRSASPCRGPRRGRRAGVSMHNILPPPSYPPPRSQSQTPPCSTGYASAKSTWG